ncbi:MAG: MBL fold metallo-hydrolase [Acholeplasmataceae bacterium]|nr:MBL fold metallo-hydrolase [Acholeplasmataceae bacterium]
MKITVLVENTTSNPNLNVEHGLSLFIETKNHHILFDAGDSDLFIENAKKLNIDLTQVDIFILSHGHHDHGGGLDTFLKINQHAKVYVQKHAFECHYSYRKDHYESISVPKPYEIDQIVYVDDQLIIDDELMLFSTIKRKEFYPQSNQNLYQKIDDQFIHDDFNHEHNLIIKEDKMYVLVAGCAHHGMINIIHEASDIVGQTIDYAVGGLHLYSRSTGISETVETIEALGSALIDTKTKLYTCHCTGEKAYEILKPIMNDMITYIRTGDQINLNE